MAPRVCRVADHDAGCSSGHTLNMRIATLLHVLCKTHDGSFAHVGPALAQFVTCRSMQRVLRPSGPRISVRVLRPLGPVIFVSRYFATFIQLDIPSRTHVVRPCACCAQSGTPYSESGLRSNAFDAYRCPAATYYLCAWPAHTFALRSCAVSPGPAQFLATWPIWPQL